MKEYQVDGHRPSFLPGDGWKLVWSDEFDGDALDASKWDTRLYMMGKRAPQLTDDAYELDGNSNLLLKLVKKDGVYCTTQLQTGYNFMDLPGEEYDPTETESILSKKEAENYFTWPIGTIKQPKFMHKYGYYECRCKMQEKEGWWSAFWLQSPIIGSTLNPQLSGVEVDIMEQFWRTKREPKHIITHNNHWNGYGSQHESTGEFQVKLKETEDGFHTFGLEWTPDAYRYYVDGEQTWVVEAPYPVSQTEQFILLSTEAVGYRNSTWEQWDDLADAVGDVFVVDYVRVFDRDMSGK